MTSDDAAAIAAPAAKRPDVRFAARVSFRAASHEDAAALVPMINDAYMREAWLLPPPRITIDDVHEELGEPETRMIMAEVDGVLAGSICLSLHDEPDFGLFAVAREFQSHGLASMLIAEAERVACEAGHRVLRLDCAKELGLPAFYESLGYRIERETPDSYFTREDGKRKGPFTLVVMRKELR